MRLSSSNRGFSQAVASSDWQRCEEAIKRFEDAWKLGQSPSIDEYLLSDGDVRRALLVELVHIDLEFRLKSGASARVEDYLSKYPDLGEKPSELVDLIAAEYRLRLRHDQDVQFDEYVKRFPQLRSELERLSHATLQSGRMLSIGDHDGKPL